MVKPAIFIDFYIQAILGQKLLKIAIVHCAIGKLEKFQVHILSYTASYYGFQKSPYRDRKLPQHERDYKILKPINIIGF